MDPTLDNSNKHLNQQPQSPQSLQGMAPSNALPPLPHPKPKPPLSVYLCAAFKPYKPPHLTPKTAAAAAYAIYINSRHSHLHHRIAEPLTHGHQSLDAALLTAFTTALTLVYPYSPHAVTIHSDHPQLKPLIFSAHPKHPDHSNYQQLLQQAHRLVDQFHRCSIDLDVVVHTPDRDPSVQQARRLADAAVKNHAFCRLCRCNYGRAGSAHHCRPLCFVSPCRGLRLHSVAEYERHVEQRHPVNVVYAEEGTFRVRRSEHNHTSSDEGSTDGTTVNIVRCPQCGGGYRDFGALARHVEEDCTGALDRWLQQTTIIKD